MLFETLEGIVRLYGHVVPTLKKIRVGGVYRKLLLPGACWSGSLRVPMLRGKEGQVGACPSMLCHRSVAHFVSFKSVLSQ